MAKSLSMIAAILLMILIFYFSQQPATISSNLSTSITERIIEAIEKIVPMGNVPVETIHHIVRKNAHFFLYFFLGIFVLLALKKVGVNGYKKVWLAFLICVIYAVSDEVHQLFVNGRSARIMDVLIDSTGAAIGIIIASIIDWKVQSRLTRAKQTPSKGT